MKTWQWQTLNDEQFKCSARLSFIISILATLISVSLIKSIFGITLLGATIFVLISFIFIIIIVLQISPFIVKKVIK